jgi:hypothetical protein
VGIQFFAVFWIPAYAGMTGNCLDTLQLAAGFFINISKKFVRLY